MTELWWSWYGDEPHASRFSRGNFANKRISLITGFNADKTQQRAMLEELKLVMDELQTMCGDDEYKYTGSSLKDMFTCLLFRDQKGDAAKEMLKQATMECMVKVRGPKSYPLLLYILLTFYWVEVFINPDFTRPWLVSHYLFTAKGILDTLESFVEHHELSKDLHLMSSGARRTINSMCHTGCHHILKMYRKAQQLAYVLDKYWRLLALRLVNTKAMEGYHGSIRTHGNDFNLSGGEWLEAASTMVMKRNILNRLKLNYKVEIGAPRNTYKENQGKYRTLALDPVPEILRGIIGTAGLVSQSDVTHGMPCSSNVIPPEFAGEITSYRHLHDVMRAGAISGLQNSLTIVETLAADMAHDLKTATPNKFGRWKVFVRPAGMKIVMDDSIASAPFEPTGADGVPKNDVAMRAELAAMEKEAAAGDEEGTRNISHEQEECSRQAHRLKRLSEIIENNQHTKARLREICATKSMVFTEKGADAKQAAQNLAVLMKDGTSIALLKALKMLQPREWIDRNRWPRFWTPAALPEHKGMPAGHDCTLGTVLVVDYGLAEKKLIAVVRVHRLYHKDTAEHSFSLKPRGKHQKFMVELCLPDGGDASVDGALRFVASGRHLPMLPGASVIGLATVRAEGSFSHTATMQASTVAELTKSASFVIVANVRDTDLVPKPVSPMQDDTDKDCCCRCQRGWWDDSTGKIVYCDGHCERAFHTSCVGLDAVPTGDWICARCTGEDTAVCAVCDKEWFCDDRTDETGNSNGYYTGAMLQCAGPCECCYHQECHNPRIEDKYVHEEATQRKSKNGKKRARAKKNLDWRCATCKAAETTQRLATRHQRATDGVVQAAAPPKSAPTRASTRARTQASDDGRVPMAGVSLRETRSHVQRMTNEFFPPTW